MGAQEIGQSDWTALYSKKQDKKTILQDYKNEELIR